MTHQGAVSKSGLNGAKPKVMMVLFVLWGEDSAPTGQCASVLQRRRRRHTRNCEIMYQRGVTMGKDIRTTKQETRKTAKRNKNSEENKNKTLETQ